MKNDTTTERTSERELVVTRTFNGPAQIASCWRILDLDDYSLTTRASS
ncbi:hypothetical protein [Peristeroidobacter soli]|nr:hypothetical protein [Peristeroidobacter soli]